jgi:hypothetical protein
MRGRSNNLEIAGAPGAIRTLGAGYGMGLPINGKLLGMPNLKPPPDMRTSMRTRCEKATDTIGASIAVAMGEQVKPAINVARIRGR